MSVLRYSRHHGSAGCACIITTRCISISLPIGDALTRQLIVLQRFRSELGINWTRNNIRPEVLITRGPPRSEGQRAAWTTRWLFPEWHAGCSMSLIR